MRRLLIAANWKMHLGRTDEALALVRRLRPPLGAVESVDVAICPPFTVLAALAEVLRNSRIGLGAQTMHWEDAGAHTGDVSPAMLDGLCDYVILGHSERREAAGPSSSDEAINRKVLAALGHGLTPIVCVGESAAQRNAGETHDFVGRQVGAALKGVGAEAAGRLVLAYEPIWAIGSGQPATPAEANRTIGLTVRGAVADGLGTAAAERVRILYGGSVKTENIAEFVRMPDIDGALVGGASLSPAFADLVKAAGA
ncbi:MAG: triose-phosphate isomerase [Gemmatimonadota bacterium]